MFNNHGRWGLSFSLKWEYCGDDTPEHRLTIRYGRHYLVQSLNGGKPYWVTRKQLKIGLPYIQWPDNRFPHSTNQLHFNPDGEFNPNWGDIFKKKEDTPL